MLENPSTEGQTRTEVLSSDVCVSSDCSCGSVYRCGRVGGCASGTRPAEFRENSRCLGETTIVSNSYLAQLSGPAAAPGPDERIALLARLMDSEAVNVTVKLNAIRAFEGHASLAANLLFRTIEDEHQEEVGRAAACGVLAGAAPASVRVLGTALLPDLEGRVLHIHRA